MGAGVGGRGRGGTFADTKKSTTCHSVQHLRGTYSTKHKKCEMRLPMIVVLEKTLQFAKSRDVLYGLMIATIA